MLALIFFLCLAIVGVVGDLTDADFVKIGSLLDKRDERLYSELGTLKSTIDALETKFDALETKFDALETKFDALNTSVGAQISDLKTYVATAFSDTHFFNRHRVEMLQKVSANFFPCSTHTATSHTVVYEGRVATVFTPHADCLNSHAFSPTNNGNYILDDIFDLAIDLRCSNTSAALDISSVYEPFLGDEIITFGYGDTASVWQGVVSARVVTKCVDPAVHWGNGTVRFCSGEIVAQGHQHGGMSGAPVLNGCGYVGVAHAVNSKTNVNDANFALVIPAYGVTRLIKKNLDRLPTLEGCRQRAVSPPLAALANCDTNVPLTPLTPSQISINAIP